MVQKEQRCPLSSCYSQGLTLVLRFMLLQPPGGALQPMC